MQTVNWEQLTSEQQVQLLARPAMADSSGLSTTVADIISNIRQRGDQALVEYTKRFDKLPTDNFTLTQTDIDNATARLSSEIKDAIKTAYEHVVTFHEAQKQDVIRVETMPGVVCEMHTQAIESVGLYIPGGSAPLPSTVIMTGAPAQIAGCSRLVLCSPPPLADEILYAASLCGVSEIYSVGGAQAIAALAYGTETIAPVDKIFGPGNSFVTEAKRQVSNDFAGAAIDMPAGPSEVLVIADESADPAFIAADLLSQAEHGHDSQTILVTPCAKIAEQTTIEITKQLALLERREIAEKAIENSVNIVCKDLEQAIVISNRYAPEHLIVQTEQPRLLQPHLKNAGSIFLGAWTPESVGDYASGTNHVLPTYGYTTTYSSLGLADFVKRYTVQELTQDGLRNLAPTVTCLAAAEGLTAHKRAVTIRMEKLNQK
ncbi:histidinol dehydrogenase [Psychromonas sp. RZ22]|uniref:histidinol dehydrogenase n=1 Tax=Psychromonas algarum TaxID=2555643 RepID=UPI0010682BFA|nr:histidinol dehydrogenase [Psychromonas sp. RZ22]TEW55389.1 histidinol dehydrogenase [Psychromonas sp. RZ22]